MKTIYFSNYMQRRKESYEYRTVCSYLALIFFIVLCILAFIFVWGPAFILSIPALLVIGFYISHLTGKCEVLHRGLWGENELRRYLSERLSDDYSAFFNVPTGYGDIDCVLVGPKGVFALEVKNHKGNISCYNKKWEQRKTGFKGTSYLGTIKDPSRQLMTGIIRLREHLVGKGLPVWINGFVVFTNPGVVLRTDGNGSIKALALFELNQEIMRKDDKLSRIAIKKIGFEIKNITWK